MAKPLQYKRGPKKGQFRPGKRKKTKKKTKTKTRTKTKRRATTAPKTKRRKPVAKKKKRRGRRRSSGGTYSGKAKLEIFGAGAAAGYVEQMPNSVMEKVPEIQAVGPDGTKAILFHYLAKNTSGGVRKWADRISVAYTGAVGLEFGRGGFKFSGDDNQLGHGGGGGRGVAVSGTVAYDPDRDEIAEAA